VAKAFDKGADINTPGGAGRREETMRLEKKAKFQILATCIFLLLQLWPEILLMLTDELMMRFLKKQHMAFLN